MIILKAKEKMSEDVIGLKEFDLTSKLHDEVVIIPEELEVVTLNHVGEQISTNIELSSVTETLCKALDELNKRSGCKCNG